MSEGINFKDDLARCVVIAGMPYPSPGDPELVARMAFMEGVRPGGGREYYENLCMKAVNQSIGRVIRHAGDYGVVLLADERYDKASVQARLPDWIQPRSSVSLGFRDAFAGAVRSLNTQRALVSSHK
jgi:chromosome transmission fidelity protein 1